MPKRTKRDEVKYYKEKIRKLNEINNKRNMRRRIIQSESSDENSDVETQPQYNQIEGSLPPSALINHDVLERDVGLESVDTPQIKMGAPEIASHPELALEYLQALGDAVDEVPQYGEEIHSDLAQRWLPLLRTGLPKDKRDLIFKPYIIPNNCKLLKAPSLNAEISAAITESLKTRDKKLENCQQQLGVGITAVNRALTLLLSDGDHIQSIKILSDASRILCDLHYQNTETRIKLLTPSLDKSLLNVIENDHDETLFGANLSEKIKAAKIIEKQGLSIKKNVPVTKPSTSSLRPRPGNWSGPPRFPSNRGGANRTACWDDDISGATHIGGEHTNAVSTALQPYKQATCSSDESTLTQVARARTTPVAYPGSSDTLRLAFSRRGVPDQALDLICASLSANTIRQYSVTFKAWWEFCNLNKFNPLEPSVQAMMSFITYRYNQGDSYGSLNTHRSALSLLLGHNVGTDDRISRILKGVYKLRPSVPKYKNTWDPQVVLNELKTWYPNSELSLEKLTKKLVMLLALCTAHRLQTFSLIKINNIKCFESVIKIYITDIIKTTRAGKDQPILSLPFFLENPSICPAKTLQEYISKTIYIRPSNVKKLLITFKRPHKAATTQTIGRWLKQTMGECGVDVAVFSAHSTRHAATSAAHSSGVSIDVIRKAAGWTAASQTFARFYQRPVEEQDSFARSIFFS